MKKVDNMQEQICKGSRCMEILLENQKRGSWLTQSVEHKALDLGVVSFNPMLGVENQKKHDRKQKQCSRNENAFDRLINRLETAQKRIYELEYMTKETNQTEINGGKKF